MGSALTGTQIKNTYPALIKFSGNGSLDPFTLTALSDGLGNDSPLLLSGGEFGTQIPSTGKPYGFWAQLFSNANISIGDYNNEFNGTWIGMNDFSQFIGTYSGNVNKGLKLDFPNKAYSVGDFNAVDNGTSIVIDDANEGVTIKANVDLAFVGTGLENTSAGISSGKFLRVLVNGNEYKIDLLEP